MPNNLAQKIRRVWTILCLAVKNFLRIDGVQWAGAFAFNAFFSLFPLMVVLVAIASSFIDRATAGKEIIAYMKMYVPISGEMQRNIFDTIAGVINAREQSGAIAFVILVWAALQCFITLVSATNRAWDTAMDNWWRLPLKSLLLLGITTGAVFLGMAVPVLMRITEGWLLPVADLHSGLYGLASFFIPLLVVFLGLSLFYRVSPRRPARFVHVGAAALFATVLLLAAESLFVLYLKNFATLNAVYGAFGGIMALLLWIYISGCIFIFGACLCAAQSERRSSPVETIATCSAKGIEP